MEISNYTIHYLEFIARINKDISLARTGYNYPFFCSCRFQRSYGGSTYSNYPVSLCLCIHDELSRLPAERIILRVHYMLLNSFLLYRAESPKAHMKGNKSKVYPLLLQSRHLLFCEMESRRRSGCGTSFPIVDSLIPFAISKLFVYIGRQRSFPQLIQYFFKNSVIQKFYQATTKISIADNFC